MATTKLQDGNVLNLTLASAVTSGGLVVQGKIVGIAQITGLTGEVIPVEVVGVQRLPKTSVDVIAVGDTVYAKAGDITAVAAGAVKCGYAVKAAAGGVLAIDVRLIPNC
jgi:predicted RecA/RadA family phage recombinase